MKRTHATIPIIVLITTIAILLAPIAPPKTTGGPAESAIGTLISPPPAKQPTAIPESPHSQNNESVISIDDVLQNLESGGIMQADSKQAIRDKLMQDDSVSVIVTVDAKESVNVVLDFFASGEFNLSYKFVNFPPFGFSGNVSNHGLRKMKANNLIKKIEYNWKTIPTLAQSVPLVNASLLWNLQITGTNITGENQTVCVVDTGVDYTNQALGFCTQNDFLAGNCNKVIGGYDYVSDDNDPMDTDGHGTHVAGIIAANGTANGTAPRAQIVALRAISTVETARQGIEWCITNRETYHISVISMSFASTYPNGSERVYDGNCDSADNAVIAANNAESYGLLPVASAGNSGTSNAITSPSCGSKVLSVGATYDEAGRSVTWGTPDPDCTDGNTAVNQIACGSNRGLHLDLMAPGGVINSTWTNPRYLESWGTSMAAPHVSGVAALLIQYWKLKNRTLSPAQLEERIKGTGKPIYDSSTSLNFSRIDAYAALFPIDVHNFSTINLANFTDSSKVFKFKARNQNNSYQNISFGLELGNGTWINTTNVSAPPKKDVLVFMEHNYTENGTYGVTAWASNGHEWNDTETLTLTRGWLSVYNLSAVGVNNTERIFRFKVENTNATINMTGLRWNMTFGDGINVSANASRTVVSGTEHFFYLWHNYTAPGTYLVNVTAGNQTINATTRPLQITIS